MAGQPLGRDPVWECQFKYRYFVVQVGLPLRGGALPVRAGEYCIFHQHNQPLPGVEISLAVAGVAVSGRVAAHYYSRIVE